MKTNSSYHYMSLNTENKEFINTHSTSSLIIATYGKKLIIGYNSWRKQWEFPAGKREIRDHDSYHTARREFFEETHQLSERLTLIGVTEILTPNQDTRYRAIFTDMLTSFIPFTQQMDDEMTELALVTSAELSSLPMDPNDLAIYQHIQKERGLSIDNSRN